MKLLWDNITATLSNINGLLSELYTASTDPRIKKAVKIIIAEYNKLINQCNELDKLIEPIQPVSIRMPFESAEFAEMWKTYKEYLIEDFAIQIGSRREQILLNKIKKLSNNNERKSIDMIELFIANGYKSVFLPSEKQLLGEEPAKTENEVINFNAKPSV